MKKLTDKQKSRFWEQRRNVNFQQSRRLEGIEIPSVTLLTGCRWWSGRE
ncbi:DUF2559 family protein [Salmonella enterica subsp. enterica serovar Kentucky]|nr:DUF2559 family protein [Salmonella enterica subsp. enterica serovar Kentucky]